MHKFLLSLITTILVFNLNAQSLYFPPTSGNNWETLSPQSLGYCSDKIDSLYAFLDTNNTKAFILLKDGKIVLEKYFGTHTQNSLWQWASAAKTITAFMVGMAQQEGFLSINDTSSKYLGKGWTSCTPEQEAKITVLNQLNMTSGLDDNVADPFCTEKNCLVFKADAGNRWAYHNGPYTLLDGVIENATGLTLNNYTTQKLKNPTGITGGFVPLGYNNVYFSNARSMARFGLLILNKGNWNGNQILTDMDYYNQMISTSQTINKSYGYLWWLNGKQSFMIPSSQLVFPGFVAPNAPADMISAMGKGGQFLNVIPSQNLVWIRMGDEPANSLVPFLLNDNIWEYVNDLVCNPTAINSQKLSGNLVQLYPNPAHNLVHLTSQSVIVKTEIYNQQGQIVHIANNSNKQITIEISDLNVGLYFIKSYLDNGKIYTNKLVKE